MATILITGAAGFIGRSLARQARAQGHRVRGLILPGEERAYPGREIELVTGDVTCPGDVERAAEGVDSVVHLAAVVTDWAPPGVHMRLALEGTRSVMEAASRWKCRVVLASSIVVYGEKLRRDICHEDLSFGRTHGPYGEAKQAQETLARELATHHRVPLVVVRPAIVYGPGSYLWVHLVVDLMRKRIPVIIGDGEGDAGLCHVEHVADLFLRSATATGAEGRTYNAADGGSITWRRYFTDLARLAGLPAPWSLPRWMARVSYRTVEPLFRLLRLPWRPPLTAEAYNVVGSHLQIPIERARAELGYAPWLTYENALESIARDLAESRTPGA